MKNQALRNATDDHSSAGTATTAFALTSDQEPHVPDTTETIRTPLEKQRPILSDRQLALALENGK